MAAPSSLRCEGGRWTAIHVPAGPGQPLVRGASPDAAMMAALPTLLPEALQRGAVKGDCADGSALRGCPGLGTEARRVPVPGHPEQLKGPHPSPLSSLHRLLAPGYTETHYAADGQPVTVAPNHTVGAGGRA